MCYPTRLKNPTRLKLFSVRLLDLRVKIFGSSVSALYLAVPVGRVEMNGSCFYWIFQASCIRSNIKIFRKVRLVAGWGQSHLGYPRSQIFLIQLSTLIAFFKGLSKTEFLTAELSKSNGENRSTVLESLHLGASYMQCFRW